MIIECGPSHDRRTMTIELPTKREKIGVLISGGLDSAILYFLISEENARLGELHEIIPFTVARKEGSKYFAHSVIEYVQLFYGIPLKAPLEVGDNTLEEIEQVASGVKDIMACGCDKVYVGAITQLPQHMTGWKIYKIVETPTFKVPFINLTKDHVVDIIAQCKQDAIFHITHSCDQSLGRCGLCNGCNERAWGFEQMNLIDPGKV